jgi:hypothetical protein
MNQFLLILYCVVAAIVLAFLIWFIVTTIVEIRELKTDVRRLRMNYRAMKRRERKIERRLDGRN